MTRFNAPAYDVDRPTGQCTFTARRLEPGETYMATLVEIDEPTGAATDGSAVAGAGFRRLDVSMQAWQTGQRPDGLFGYWKTVVPEPNQKKKIFVDDDVLMNLFDRLADNDQPQRRAFRFVLGLILMRKRLLRYEGSTKRTIEGAEQQWWQLIPKGASEAVDVLNPQLDEPQIQQVTDQLGEILDADL